jgi:hypothetical protein|tara:strand:- start:73 stop:417 length:345 start_codon:yes stop_codon:yes gene_type:complete
MNNNKIIIYFLFGCMFARLFMVYIAKIINVNYLPYFGILTLFISIMFLKNYLYSSNFKTGFFGNKVWWNNNRLIHSLLYFIFSFMAFYKNKNAWIILLLDTIFGLITFIIKYFK